MEKAFLNRFRLVDWKRDWIVIVTGRFGCLRLTGPEGIFRIFVCYFDLASKTKQCEDIKKMAGYVHATAHSLLVGDFNFVHRPEDHFVKESRTWSLGDSKRVDDEWRRPIASKGVCEWAQDMLTCGLDRVYSSLHCVHNMMDGITCSVLDRRPDLSAHRPISFHLQDVRSKWEFRRLPA